MYFAITGGPPIPAVSRVMTDRLLPLTDRVQGYSRGFLQAIDAALALRPEDRPQSVSAFREILAQTDTQGSPAGRPIEPTLSVFPPAPVASADQPSRSQRASDRSSAPSREADPRKRPLRVKLFAWAGGALAVVGLAALAVLWTESPVKAPVEAKPSEQPIALEPPGKKPGASDIFEANPPPPQTSGDSEVTAWKAAEQTHSGAAYQAYLDRYPDGMFAALARSRLSDLEAAAWQSAEQLNSRRGYQRFLDEYPNSALVALANSRMKQLR